jgi:hypothetical protein
MREIRKAFESAGVIFVSGTSDGGPGVRLVSGQPRLIRQPAFRKKWGLDFGVEWQGREVTILVSFEAIYDLGGFSGTQPESSYQKVFVDQKVRILGAAARALAAGKIDRYERVTLTAEDFPGIVPALSIST